MTSLPSPPPLRRTGSPIVLHTMVQDSILAKYNFFPWNWSFNRYSQLRICLGRVPNKFAVHFVVEVYVVWIVIRPSDRDITHAIPLVLFDKSRLTLLLIIYTLRHNATTAIFALFSYLQDRLVGHSGQHV